MDKKKDQFIALCADNRDDAEQLLPVAKTLAASLKKDIILFTCSPDGDCWVETLGIPFAAIKSDWPTVVEAMPTAFNVILALTLIDNSAPRTSPSHPHQILKNFRNSKIAYLLLPKKSPLIIHHSSFTTVLTLDHQRESKEKLLWASYLQRFCNSPVTIFHHPYTDTTLRNHLDNNIRYLDKIFSSFNLTYILQSLPPGNQFANPDLHAVKTLVYLSTYQSINPIIFISLVPDPRDRDLFDILSSSPALRLIKKAPSLPILFLNQRDDLYILCD